MYTQQQKKLLEAHTFPKSGLINSTPTKQPNMQPTLRHPYITGSMSANSLASRTIPRWCGQSKKDTTMAVPGQFTQSGSYPQVKHTFF